MIPTAWPDLTVLAHLEGEVDPHGPANAHRFRGEEAFNAGQTGWHRWSKPSPEPRTDPTYRQLLLRSIDRESTAIAGMVANLADQVARADVRPPILIAILRAGVPVGALLARRLSEVWGEVVPLLALSLFDGLGWDESALIAALALHPGRPVWFVDGWTSGGGVAREFKASHSRWLLGGRPDFTDGKGPRLAVLLDPRGAAEASAGSSDRFIPSAGFTAPATLGFSRGFARAGEGLFGVYRYPESLVDRPMIRAWLEIVPTSHPVDLEPVISRPSPPRGWRVHVNEVVRALINREPFEVWFANEESEVADRLAPVLYLCRHRGIPVEFDRPEVRGWGALAAARMDRSAELPQSAPGGLEGKIGPS